MSGAGPSFGDVLRDGGLGPIVRTTITTLQVNLGRRCNQACVHCHLGAGPTRSEELSADVATRLLELLDASPRVEVVDLTGGAPELCGQFRRLVAGARERGRRVIDRSNLTVLLEPGQEDTAAFLAEHQVRIIASLPCYLEENVDRQRGRGVHARSLEALRRLNDLGFGKRGSTLELDLMYNPGGPFLPPAVQGLEEAYRTELGRRGISFHRLLTMTNVPLSRFLNGLERRDQAAGYRALLVDGFNPCAVPNVMCRSMISVDWRGAIYDCDFNQAADLPILGGQGRTVFDLASIDRLSGLAVAIGDHCFACTAGAGSSCGGAIAS